MIGAILLSLGLVLLPVAVSAWVLARRRRIDRCRHPARVRRARDGRPGVEITCAACGAWWIEQTRPVPSGQYDKATQSAGTARAKARDEARRDVEARGAQPARPTEVVDIRKRRTSA